MSGRSFDVVVIGLGPAGASAAAACARRGLKTLALDRRRRAGVPVQCAEFVPALIGAQAGVLAASVRQPIRAMTTAVEREAACTSDDFTGHIVDRVLFDAALVDAAVRAGADCRLGTPVRAVTPDGRVLVAGGECLTAATVIGADGPRSIVGRRIGAVNRELLETRQVTVALYARHLATDIFLSADIPGGYGWLFPKGDRAHIGAGVDPAHRPALKPIVARLHASLVGAGRVGTRVLALTGGAIPAGGLLKPWGMAGEALVLLAGDAAGLTNPVTGAGIAAAVSSGTLAGEAAAAWRAGDRAAGEAYEDELRGLFQPALDRALERRRERAAQGAHAGSAALRRAWIAYPEYWR
jgi:geranylgeranyl reductase family protein